MSFMSYVESKRNPSVTVSLDHYKETVERAVYDEMLDLNKRREFVLSNLADSLDLSRTLRSLCYPQTDSLLLSVATRDPIKIKRAHEAFSFWARRNGSDHASFVDASLFECRSYLYGKEVEFSKEMADRIVSASCEETEENAKKIAATLDRCISRINEWHNSTVILKVLKPDNDLISNEGMVIVGQPPAMTFMCRQTAVKMEVYDIQDIEGYPLSVQEDYSSLLRLVQGAKPKSEFSTYYFVSHPKERSRFDGIKRELALGFDVTLPVGVFLEESAPDVPDMDVWRVKLKRGKISNETPVRWLDLIRKV